MNKCSHFPFKIDYFNRELELPNLEIILDTQFGSRSSAHRMAIRQEILTRVSNDPKLLDLSIVPQQSTYSLSISHTYLSGGFAFSKDPGAIGFDIELTSRILTSAVKRISRYEEEFNEAPAADFLWTAKEASFKALSSGHLNVFKISDTRVTEWLELEPGAFRFKSLTLRSEKNRECTGLCWRWEEFTLAIAKLSSPV